jgi:hypothetical protein
MSFVNADDGISLRMTDYAVEGLKRRRSEIAGRIKRMQAEIAKDAADIEHLDAVLRLIAPELEIAGIAPKIHVPPESWSKRGEMSRSVLSVLRLSQIPLTSRQVATQLISERGLATTPQLLTTVTKRVNGCLRDRRSQGLVRNVGNPLAMWLLWEIAR